MHDTIHSWLVYNGLLKNYLHNIVYTKSTKVALIRQHRKILFEDLTVLSGIVSVIVFSRYCNYLGAI